MARYLVTAAKANKVAVQLMEMIPTDKKPVVAAMIAQLVNYGFRCNPRPAQSIIRYNAVQAAVKGLPVTVSMVPVSDGHGGTFQAFSAEPLGGKAIVEGDSDE